MSHWKDKVTKFCNGRYGLDDLGKSIFIVGIVLYVVGTLLQNSLVTFMGMFGLLIFLFRSMSGDKWDRIAENRKYLCYVKLWKLRYENRDTARIYLCPNCGRYIRVPKGKGKIQITCPGCKNTLTKRT